MVDKRYVRCCFEKKVQINNITKKDIEILFNNINYYQENLKIYNDNMREKLEKELLRVRKMKLVK